MRAVEITAFGAPEVLRLGERPLPQAGGGELLIRVGASGINRPDVLQRLGHYAPPPGATGAARTVNREGKRIPLAHFAHTVGVYLNSAFAVTSQAAEAMAKNEPLASNPRGVVINTASIAGYEGQPGQAAYSAAKGGIIGMTLTIARDLAPIGVRAMAIAPGTFLTLAYSARMTDEEAQAKWGPMVPNPHRMGDPDEYAQLAAHICENDFLNGTTIRLDGAQRF